MQVAIGLIGCGAWGSNHARVWSELGALKAVCDIDESRLAAMATRYPGLRTFSRLDDLLGQPDIHAVVVATPAPTHLEVASAALNAGKHALVEKPLALRAHEGRILVEAARRQRRLLMVGHVLEYHPAVERLRELVGRGELGRVQYVYSNRLNLGRIRTEENVLWSFAPHDVALVLRLVGLKPDSVACHGGSYVSSQIADTTLTTLSFASGVRAHIFVSWLHPVKEHRFVVVGDRQMAVFDDGQPWESKLLLFPHRVDWLDGRLPVARSAEATRVELTVEEPLRRQCRHFLQCATEGTEPLSNGESGVAVLEVLEAAQAALSSGAREVRAAACTGSSAYFVHPTAVVDEGAEIGGGTRIWHYSHLMGASRIGRNCVLGQNVFIGSQVRIGDGVKIQNNVSVYTGVTLEDGVFCGPSMVFTNVMNPRSELERKDEFKSTVVRRGATLGASCTIVCGVTIGTYAFVAAGAVVTRDVRAYALVMGVPARQVGWVCRCGVKLTLSDGFARCHACSACYVNTQGTLHPADPGPGSNE